jgi:hypothetical protein
MAAGFQALAGQREVALRWRRDVNDVWLGSFQHLARVCKPFRNFETLAELLCHEQLAVTERDDLAVWNPPDRPDMLIRDLAATDESYA